MFSGPKARGALAMSRVRAALGRLFRHHPVNPAARAVDDLPPDLSSDDRITWRAIERFTMTSPERIAALCNAVRYTVKYGIPGAIVECGVWRGGSMMAVARTLLQLGVTDRSLYLFDTFEGMPEPTYADVDLHQRGAHGLLRDAGAESSIRAVSTLETTRAALLSTGYPAPRMIFVKGRVENTIPVEAPEQISILRLDTDWYESTRHELEHLFPRLSTHGVLIIDDYGHWLGARRAVDEYLLRLQEPILLQRIDYTGRIAVKPRYQLPR